MSQESYEGICCYCNEVVTKRTVGKHIEKCKAKIVFDSQFNNEKNYKYFSLLVEATYGRAYWILVEVSSVLTLKKVDTFLRDIWLECCGHLSAFSIKRNEIAMNKKLYDVYQQGLSLDYEYDFGSTTDLKIKMLAQIDSSDEKPIRVLAINKKPEILCSSCEKILSVYDCTSCGEQVCESCAKTHQCFIDEGEEYIAERVNSPRSGVCGYEGQNESIIKKYFPKEIPNVL
ncbi:MAG: hypothetical protein COZ80_10125 [Ignavibacteria bacterium CG_4_8_14_3_um_filter_37_9]|nr:hypothetical protein [Ignavibacteria bacterium]OIO23549.1 MAG: hypothetical protein AUJ54_01465 [Ignavibacteria bacterium CG1_02_37_35]PIS46370.1 MAG: hypothetical protein COT22_00365 [Ignavibacteria bacterium CG08_land_8_20_14_0_20_37_9]PIW98543.1 MAG: hypothetical protein COZ80_10125 [Ignavibacteria bacterium CG_4_8_14_3_um_filter_37_9]